MALLDILTGQQGSSGRVPPLAKALAGLLAYSKLKNPGGEGSAPADGAGLAERLEDFFKPSASGGPTAKGVIGALLTGGLMDLVQQFRGAGKAEAVESWVARGPNQAVSPERSIQGIDRGADRFPDRAHRPVARGASGGPKRAPAAGG